MKNGKRICEQLKQIRLDIARENGIEYTPCECNHKGDCAGTCPACDSELRYLEREISRKRFGLGKAAIISISVGAISISLTSCVASGALPDDQREEVEDTTAVIEELPMDSIVIDESKGSTPVVISDSGNTEQSTDE